MSVTNQRGEERKTKDNGHLKWEISNRKEAIRHRSTQLFNRKFHSQCWNLQVTQSSIPTNSLVAQASISPHVYLWNSLLTGILLPPPHTYDTEPEHLGLWSRRMTRGTVFLHFLVSTRRLITTSILHRVLERIKWHFKECLTHTTCSIKSIIIVLDNNSPIVFY